MKGYVFSGIMRENEVKQLLENYFFEPDVFFITHDSVRYIPGKGVPSDLCDEGRTFSEMGEIRWKRQADGNYFVSVLSERQTGVPEEFTKSSLEFEVKEGNDILLVDSKKERYISPPFDNYPENARKLKVSYYMHEGIALLTRLKRLG